jgi:ATP-dependent Clp protease ATP-binding subunit ClpA
MGEFHDRYTASRLYGALPGYGCYGGEIPVRGVEPVQ